MRAWPLDPHLLNVVFQVCLDSFLELQHAGQYNPFQLEHSRSISNAQWSDLNADIGTRDSFALENDWHSLRNTSIAYNVVVLDNRQNGAEPNYLYKMACRLFLQIRWTPFEKVISSNQRNFQGKWKYIGTVVVNMDLWSAYDVRQNAGKKSTSGKDF